MSGDSGRFLNHGSNGRDVVEILIGDGTSTIVCVPCRCSVPAPTERPKPRGGVRPQNADAEKRAQKERDKQQARQRPGGRVKPCIDTKPAPPKVSRPARVRPFPVVAVACLLVLVVVLGNLDTIQVALVAALHAVLYALLVAGLTAAALAAGYANGRWVVPAAGNFIRYRVSAYVEHRRDLAALREVLAAEVERDRAPIVLGPVTPHENAASPAEQEWIRRGMARAHFDDEHFAPVYRGGAA